MHIAKLADSELREARRAGFKTRKPKQGKLKTMNAMEGFVSRNNDWVRRAKDKIKDHKKKESDKKKLKDLKAQIRRS